MTWNMPGHILTTSWKSQKEALRNTWNALKRFQCMKTRPGAKREQWYKILFCSFVKCFVESRYMMRNNENQSEALFSPLHAVLQDELVDVLGTEYIFFHFLSEYRSDASRVDSDGRW